MALVMGSTSVIPVIGRAKRLAKSFGEIGLPTLNRRIMAITTGGLTLVVKPVVSLLWFFHSLIYTCHDL